MSWQGQWAGASAGRWYGYTAEVPPIPEEESGGIVGIANWPRGPRPRIAWLTARLEGHGQVFAGLSGINGYRARKRREEEWLRVLH